jgi:cobalt-precorrin 5A hydrolase
VDGVCEPCALIAATRGRLLLPKNALGGVTVAIVQDRGFDEPPGLFAEPDEPSAEE